MNLTQLRTTDEKNEIQVVQLIESKGKNMMVVAWVNEDHDTEQALERKQGTFLAQQVVSAAQNDRSVGIDAPDVLRLMPEVLVDFFVYLYQHLDKETIDHKIYFVLPRGYENIMIYDAKKEALHIVNHPDQVQLIQQDSFSYRLKKGFYSEKICSYDKGN